MDTKEFKQRLKLEFLYFEYYEALDFEAEVNPQRSYCYRFYPEKEDVFAIAETPVLSNLGDTYYDTEKGYLAKHNIFLRYRCDYYRSGGDCCNVLFLKDRGTYRKVTKFTLDDIDNAEHRLLGDLVLAFIRKKRKRQMPEGCLDFDEDMPPFTFLYVQGHANIIRAKYSNNLIVDLAELSFNGKERRRYSIAKVNCLGSLLYGNASRLPSIQEAAFSWFHPKFVKHLERPDLDDFEGYEAPAQFQEQLEDKSDSDWEENSADSWL